MRPRLYVLTAILLFSFQRFVTAQPAPAAENKPLVSLHVLEAQAKQRVNAKSWVSLTGRPSDSLQKVDGVEVQGSGQIPNYLLALSPMPGVPMAYSHLMKTLLLGGTLDPETKMTMGLRIAQMHGNPYVVAHMERFLRATSRGQAMLVALQQDTESTLAPADRLALNYAENLTRGVHDVSDKDFVTVRGYFNDAQIVELTMTVCFFNYFDRLTEALNLPLEPWVLDSPAKLQAVTSQSPSARVALISDAEMKATADAVAALNDPKKPSNGWGIGVANSIRALMRDPDVAEAWMSYGAAVRQSAVISKELQLQVSFAVSLSNGCRYCTIHQVLGLRKLGVSMSKLMQMKKNDGALTPQELVAVRFARKLSRDPSSMTIEDYEKLRKEFGEQGALDTLLQTGMFSGFNRFTDGLRLPSEDAAVQNYNEVYGVASK
jgi:AhpD family alkylhydroperoxidase